MRALTPILLVLGWLSSVQCFTGLASPRVSQRVSAVSSTSSIKGSGKLHRVTAQRTCDGVMLAAKPTAAPTEDTRVDPAVVEAALVEEDKYV